MRWALAFCLGVLTTMAQAQTVAIRSGEHAEFSRLTMNLPSRPNWQIEASETGARLIIEQPNLTLDPSSVFTRIPRDRLTDLSWQADTSVLELDFDCACEAVGFWHDNSLLVVDVRVKSNPPETAQPSAMGNTAMGQPQLSRPQSRAADLALRGLRNGSDADLESLAAEVPQISSDVRDGLLQQIGRAATQGLLTPRIDRPDPSRPTNSPDPGADTAPSDVPILADTVTDHVNIRAESSIDRDFLASVAAQQRNLVSAGCLPNARVNVAAWGTEAPFGQQMSNVHRSLTGEFDDIDLDTALRLVRLYLYFGFGAEARVTLDMVGDDNSEKPVLAALSRIAERGHAPSHSPLSGQLECDGPAALWSALSYAELPTDIAIETDAILRAFDALPDHLRAYYGPILSTRFLEARRQDVSDKILRILNRSTDTLTAQSDLAAAQLLQAKGEDAAADSVLADVVESNSEPSADALIEMIEHRFATNREITRDQAKLVGAYAFEQRDQPLGKTLTAAHARALIASGATDQAFEVLRDAATSLDPPDFAALQSDLFTRLAEQAEDMTFLRYSIPLSQTMPDALSIEAVNTVAARLLDRGFPKESGAFLARDVPENHSGARTRQILRARAALALQTPRLAIVELLGLTGSDADLLRAQARSMAGDHRQAHFLYAAAEQPEQARREALLSEDWTLSTEGVSPLYAELAAVMQADTPDPADPNTTDGAVLSENRALLDTTETLRRTLQGVLADNPAPDTAPVPP